MTGVGTNGARTRRFPWRLASLLIAGAGIALVMAANAHLVRVAFESQPECVPHAKQSGEAGGYRAARSAC